MSKRAGVAWASAWCGAWLLAGCGSSGSSEGDDTTGNVSLQLRAEVNDIAYRLRDGVFDISGPQNASLGTEGDPEAASIVHPLLPGAYNVALQPGWRLEREFATGFETVNAELISDNPRSFEIVAEQTTGVTYQFLTNGTRVVLGEGAIDIGISVIDTSNPAGAGVTQISAGREQTCAVFGSGNVRCWGRGRDGTLGYGNTSDIGDNETPASAGDVSVGGAVTQIAAGGVLTCAVLFEGSVRCWGVNLFGALGQGRAFTGNVLGDDELPSTVGVVDVGGVVQQVATGLASACALLSTGSVRCWGSGGSTGDGETPAAAPEVNIGASVHAIAIGASHWCALLDSGDVRCWGSNQSGALGYPHVPFVRSSEVADFGNIELGGRATQLVAGDRHSCALLESGGVRCWGFGGDGALGNYGITIGDDETPASAGDIDLGGRAIQIAAGQQHTCAVLADGRVRCWGHDISGSLGVMRPDYVLGDGEVPTIIDPIELGGPALQITAGGAHTCALLATGSVRCWGEGGFGRLGYGNSNDIGDDETPASAGDVAVE